MPAKKSAKTSAKTSAKKSAKTSVTKDDPKVSYDESDDEPIEGNPEEDDFFDDTRFTEFNSNIKFHVFDPEKYKTEMHKEVIIVPNANRKTSDVISKYEFTDVTSNRAKQIEDGSKIFVDIKDESNPIKMAEMEIRMKKCPLSVMRYISSNMAEVWHVNDLIIPY